MLPIPQNHFELELRVFQPYHQILCMLKISDISNISNIANML